MLSGARITDLGLGLLTDIPLTTEISQTLYRNYNVYSQNCITGDGPPLIPEPWTTPLDLDQAQSTSGTFSTNAWPNDADKSLTCCNLAHQKWSQAHESFTYYQAGLIPRFYSAELTSWVDAKCDGPFTTLCDGIPRAMCVPTPTKTVYAVNWREEVAPYTITTKTTAFTIPAPTCSIDMKGCKTLWADLQPLWKPNPMCPGPLVNQDFCRTCRRAWHQGEADLDFGAVELILWHQNVTEELLCPLHPNQTQPVQVNGPLSETRTEHFTTGALTTILTSPTIYAFFKTFSVKYCGSVHYDVLVPFASTDVATVIGYSQVPWSETYLAPLTPGHWSYQTVVKQSQTYSFPLIPFTAYAADRLRYFYSTASTIYQDYMETVSLTISPDVLSSIDPMYQNCQPVSWPWQDPPRVITGTVGRRLEPATLPTNRPSENELSDFRPAITVAVSKDETIQVSIITEYTIQIEAVISPTTKANSRLAPETNGIMIVEPNLVQTPITFTVDGREVRLTQVSSGTYHNDGNTLSIGGTRITLSNVVISAVSSGLVIQSISRKTNTPVSDSETASNSDVSGPSRTPSTTISSTTKKSTGWRSMNVLPETKLWFTIWVTYIFSLVFS